MKEWEWEIPCSWKMLVDIAIQDCLYKSIRFSAKNGDMYDNIVVNQSSLSTLEDLPICLQEYHVPQTSKANLAGKPKFSRQTFHDGTRKETANKTLA